MCFIVYLIILSLYHSHAVKVDIYKVESYITGRDRPVTTVSDFFKFGYHVDEHMMFEMTVYNIPLNTTAVNMYLSRGHIMEKDTRTLKNENLTYFSAGADLNYETIIIDIEIVTKTSSCRIRIAEGRVVTSPPTWPADEGYEYSDICIGYPICWFRVYLKNECEGSYSNTNKAKQNISDTLLVTMVQVLLIILLL